MTCAAVVLGLLSANPYLGEGREAFARLEYEKALGPLTLASQVPGQTQLERREAFDLLARTHAALGDLNAAAATYAALLEKDPIAPAPVDAAPKIREAFRAGKASVFPPGTVKLTRVTAGENQLSFELFDPWNAVASLSLIEIGGALRTIAIDRRGSGFDGLNPTGLGLVQVAVPPTLMLGWVEAVDAQGVHVGQLGSAKSPLRFSKSPAPAVAATRPPPATALERNTVMATLRAEACLASRAGELTRASAAWMRAFSLDPGISPPDDCKWALPTFQAARTWALRHPRLTLKVSAALTPSGATHLVLEPQNDSMKLVQQARFHLRTEAGWAEVMGLTVDHPMAVLGYWVEALGDLGTLITVGSATDQLVPTAASDAPVVVSLTPAPSAESLAVVASRQRPWRAPLALSMAGAAVVSVGVGIGFGAASRTDAATLLGLPSSGVIDQMTQREAFALAARQRSEALTANVALGLAAGFAVTSLLILLLTAEPTP